jgi:hypothetical protein
MSSFSPSALADCGKVSFQHDKNQLRLFLIASETDLMEIIVWLVQNCGYDPVTPTSQVSAQRLLAAEQAVMVVSQLGTPFWASSDILAFCHPRHPLVPVVIASRDTLGKLPMIEHLVALSQGEHCNAGRFQIKFRQRINGTLAGGSQARHFGCSSGSGKDSRRCD